MTSLLQVYNQASAKIRNVGGRQYDLKGTPPEWWPTFTSNDSGIHVSEKSALTHMAYLRGINLLAGSIATQPKHLFFRGENGKEVARNKRAHKLISKTPNQFQNSYQFHFYMVTMLLMHGNFYAYINRDAFYEPVSLRPIYPSMVEPRVRKDGVKEFHVRGENINKVFSNNEIFHVYGLSLDGVMGINPIKYAAETLGLGLAAKKMQSSAFGKGLHAGGVIHIPEEYKGTMGSTDEESEQFMEAVRKSFRKLYQNGPDSWHEMMFLEPGWKFEQFKLNLETAKIIETRKFDVADIARLLGIPLHKLMEMDKATESNIEQQGIEYVQDGVMPITLNIEAEADAKLLKTSEQDDYFYKYNLDGLMRGTLKERFEAYSTALGKNAPGFMTPGEIRDLEDLGPADESELFKPDNMNKQNMIPETA